MIAASSTSLGSARNALRISSTLIMAIMSGRQTPRIESPRPMLVIIWNLEMIVTSAGRISVATNTAEQQLAALELQPGQHVAGQRWRR